MCDPLTAVAIGSAAASGAGSLISGNEANANAKAQQDARNAATLAEVQRQKVYGDQSRGEFDKSQALFDPGTQAANLTKSQSDVGSLITGNAPTAASVGTITSATAPKVVGDTENSKLGDVFTRIGQNAINLGNLKGYDQNNQANNLALTQQGRNIDTIGDISKTSAGVNKLEQNAAFTNAYQPPSGIGQLLSFGGNVGSYYAGGGKVGLPKFTGSTAAPGFNPATFNPTTSAGAIY
jgi:hypothetical protein